MRQQRAAVSAPRSGVAGLGDKTGTGVSAKMAGTFVPELCRRFVSKPSRGNDEKRSAKRGVTVYRLMPSISPRQGTAACAADADKTPLKAHDVRAVPSDKVTFIEIDESADGQRLDNFLLKVARGVPKSHLYRVIRAGEVRVNKKRTEEKARLNLGDIVRVPPIRVSEFAQKEKTVPAISETELPVLFEDRDLLVVNKPSGLAAHGGSGVAFGLIERLRASRPAAPFLELAHRLDRDTSGVIIICKTRKALVRLHEMQREGKVEKHYRLLVTGDWVNDRQHVKAPLAKYTLASGERRVRVDAENGLASHTIFTKLARYGDVSYLDAELKTGRTHQIRVHALSEGHPLAGDDKYGSYDVNAALAKGSLGVPLKRLFLHAFRLTFRHPVTGENLTVTAPLPPELTRVLEALEKRSEGDKHDGQ